MRIADRATRTVPDRPSRPRAEKAEPRDSLELGQSLPREAHSRARMAARLMNMPQLGLGEQSLKRLSTRSEWMGVLAGLLPGITLNGRDHKWISDLQVLTLYQAMATQQDLRLEPDPQQKGRWRLYNGEFMAQQFPETRMKEDFEDGRLHFDPDRWTDRVTRKVEKFNQQHRSLALSAMQHLDPASPMPASPDPGPARMHWIGYVSTPHQMERFRAVVESWAENLTTFGHTRLPVVYCDDSPEPYASEIRQLLAEKSRQTGIDFLTVGKAEKLAVAQRLREKLSPQLSGSDLEAVIDLMVGQGPTQNRNFSLQLLGPQGGLQLDHDMTAEILAVSPQEVRLEQAREHNWRKVPQGGTDQPVALPYDLLQNLQTAPQDRLSSLRFCGSNDIDVRHLVAAAPPQLQRSQWLGPENRDATSPSLVYNRYGNPMGGSLRSPMHVPANWDPSALLAPQVRDGDLAVGTTALLTHGSHPQELPLYVHHRDQAGGRWGGAALLDQYKTFEQVQRCLFAWVPERGLKPQEVGQKILAGLESGTYPPLDWSQEKWAVRYFEEYRQEALAELDARLAQLGTPQAESAIQSWGGSLHADQCKEEWTQIRQRLQSELDDIQKRFPRPDGELDTAQVESRTRQAAAPILRTYALALIHSQQIQECFGQLRERGGL